MSAVVLRSISPDFSGLSSCGGQVAYVLLTRAPVAGGIKQALRPAAPRLACVKPVASVHPEPGSNSPLFILFFSFLFRKGKTYLLCLPKARLGLCLDQRIDARLVLFPELLLYYSCLL